MQKCIFTAASGESLIFTQSGPYRLRYFDGNSLGSTAAAYSALGQDGQTSQGSVLNPRTIRIGAGIKPVRDGRWDRALMHRMMQEVGRVFAPGPAGTLIYLNDVGAYQIRCRCEELPLMDQVVGPVRSFELALVADEPLWLSRYEFKHRLGQVVGGKRYPLRYPLRFGLWIKDITVEVDTGLQTPVVVEINSSAQYILLTNETTGQWLQVDRSIGANQRMVIDTGAATVELLTYDETGVLTGREYANYKLTLDSRYWQLQPGPNYITLDNGYPGSSVTATIRYYKRYAGV